MVGNAPDKWGGWYWAHCTHPTCYWGHRAETLLDTQAALSHHQQRLTVTETLHLHIPGEPKPQGSKKAYVRGRRAVLVEANPGLKTWRTTITHHARKHAGAYTGERPLHVTYRFILTRPKSVRRWLPWVKPDLDKLIRAVNDGLGDAGVWDDDGRITTITAWKIYETPEQKPGVFITIREDKP